MKTLKGFTLIEMAVVFTIVAFLVGGLLIPLTTQIDVTKIQSTEKTLAQVKEALINYAVANNRLPCPASDENTGLEYPTLCDDTSNEGFLPWANLGIGRYDAWGQTFQYHVDSAYTQNIVDPNRNILVETESNLAVRYSPSQTIEDVVAIIISYGKNGKSEASQQFSRFEQEPNSYLFKSLAGIGNLLVTNALADNSGNNFYSHGNEGIYSQCTATSNCDDLLVLIATPQIVAEIKVPTKTLGASAPLSDLNEDHERTEDTTTPTPPILERETDETIDTTTPTPPIGEREVNDTIISPGI